MITHNEITALLWLAVATSSGWAGLAIGHWYWPLRSRLDDEYDRGYRKGAHDGYSGGYADGWYDAVHSENVPRPGDLDESRVSGPSSGPGRTYSELTPLAMSLDALEPDGLPPPPADLSAWWASELDGVVSNGQSDWYTAMAGL